MQKANKTYIEFQRDFAFNSNNSKRLEYTTCIDVTARRRKKLISTSLKQAKWARERERKRKKYTVPQLAYVRYAALMFSKNDERTEERKLKHLHTMFFDSLKLAVAKQMIRRLSDDAS